MPSISSFFGITIYMYRKDHNPPHFHALYNGYDCQEGTMFKWAVMEVEPKEDFTLLLTFAKGKKRLFDCKKYLFNDDYAKPLQDLSFFMKARADHHTVMWTNELDIAPEYLYEKSVKVK